MAATGVIPTVGVEVAFTVPVAATFCVAAPVLVCARFPAGVPAVAPVKRTKIVVVATVPVVGVKFCVAAKPATALVWETSNPAGAVMVISAVKFTPETV